MGGRRQKIQYQPALFAESRGEAPMAAEQGVEPPVAGCESESRAEDEQLMKQVVSPENAQAAMGRVISNRGAPGVDGMTVDELPAWLRTNWSVLGREACWTAATDHSRCFGWRYPGPRAGSTGSTTIC